MRKTISITIMFCAVALLPLLAWTAFGKEKTAEKQSESVAAEKIARPVIVYRVHFAVRQMKNGKTTDIKIYSVLIEDGSWGRVRTQNEIFLPIDGNERKRFEVGLSIRCRLRERNGHVLLDTTLDINNVAAPGEGEARPIVRHIRTQVGTAVRPGKPTVVSVIDDATTKERYELEITAVKVN